MEDRTLKIGRIAAATVMLVVWMSPVMLAGDGVWEVARADYAWSFPEDHWARGGYKTEWWYFTGHLESETGRSFGYQFTFFRVGLLRERPEVASAWGAKDLIMGHVAITEMPYRQHPPSPEASVGQGGGPPAGAGWGAGESRGKSEIKSRGIGEPTSGDHRFSEVLYRAVPLLGGFGAYPDTLVAWSRGPAGTEGVWELKWNGEAFDFSAVDDDLGFSFSLSTKPAKNLILQGPNGFSRKGDGASAASQYYSFTRLKTEGIVTIDGAALRVTGQSWMDKEFFTNSISSDQVGWDWFSLQLHDNRELMLYVLRDGAGKVNHARGTLVEADGTTQFLERDGFQITETETWESPSGDSYPSGWTLRVPAASLDMVVRPKTSDQENRSELIPTLRYWEGAVEVKDTEGREIGVGFIEMTGYGSATTPAI